MYFVFSLILVSLYVIFNYVAEKPVNKKSWAWVLGSGLFIGGVFHVVNYFSMPTLSYDCWPLYFELVAFVAISIFITSLRVSDGDTGLELDNDAICRTFLGVLVGVGLMLLAYAYSWDFFHQTAQREQLEVKDTIDVRKDTNGASVAFSPIPVEKMKLQTKEVVKRKALNQLGDLKTTFELSDFTLQSATVHCDIETFDGKKRRLDYDNQLIYVAILEFKNFWTWQAQEYAPAYVLADATTGDVYIVTKVNGKDIQIRYTHEADPFSTVGANFSYNLERHLRNNGYANVILDDFNVEIDENGRPFAPVTTLKKAIDMFTYDVTGVAVVDIQTGDIKWYTPQNAPAFVNRIYPEWLIYERITNWGKYPNGYFHWDNNSGLLQPCEGMDIVQTKNGCCYYVGIQATSGKFDTEGYMLINIRTGEATYYKREGIPEVEAINALKSANYKNGKTEIVLSQQINDSILYLTEPIFYNIEGKNTFFAMFIAHADLTVRYYAFCSADSKEVIGIGTTLEEARTDYLNSYYKSFGSKDVKFAEKHILTTVEVQVLEKSVVDNVFYFRFKGYENKVFKTTLSDEMSDILWQPTKKVKISFSQTDSKFVELKSYELLH